MQGSDCFSALGFSNTGEHIDPFRTAVPFWGQTSQISSSLPPKRDCGSKGVKEDLRQIRKAIFFAIYTNDIWSYSLWSPEIERQGCRGRTTEEAFSERSWPRPRAFEKSSARPLDPLHTVVERKRALKNDRTPVRTQPFQDRSPVWGQITWSLSILRQKWDCSPKRVDALYGTTRYNVRAYQVPGIHQHCIIVK